MSYAGPARSISSEPAPALPAWKRTLLVMWETMLVIARTRVQGMGVLGYTLTWLMFPLMQMVTLAFIYRDNRELLEYAVVASAGMAMLFGLIYNGGEILDTERGRGTLGNLFLAPIPRYVWLGGFQLFALVETLVNSTIAIVAGAWWFGIELSVDLPALLATVLLLTSSLWGLSMILGSIGITVRNANFLSNLIFPFVTLLAGTMYPIARMPDWVRIPARCLPFGYGIEALVASLTTQASLWELRETLLPLLGFAIVLPLAGTWMFRQMERAVRASGTLEIA